MPRAPATLVGVRIRDATVDDLAAISAIYNATIPTTTAAWTEHPESLADRRAWFAHQQAAGNATLVADDEGTVVGFTAYGDFRDTTKWPGYCHVVELTVHVTEAHWGAGVGRALIAELVDGLGSPARRRSWPASTATTRRPSASTAVSASARSPGCRRSASSSAACSTWC